MLTYYALNREKRLTYGKNYYQKNKDKLSAYGKKYASEHKEQFNEYARKNYKPKDGLTNCSLCGVKINNKGGRLYCVDCKKIKMKEWVKKYNQKFRKCLICGIKPKPNKRYCDVCSLKIKEQRKVITRTRGRSNSIPEKTTTLRKRLSKEWYKFAKNNTPEGKAEKARTARRRKASKKNIKELFKESEWIEMRDATKGICPSCKTDVGINEITLDHIYPISKAKSGREYTLNDIQPLCRRCNGTKTDKI